MIEAQGQVRGFASFCDRVSPNDRFSSELSEHRPVFRAMSVVESRQGFARRSCATNA